MTTAVTDVTEEDGSHANPFSQGAGRIDLTKAGTPGLTFDETASRFFELAGNEATAVNLNLPSINAPTMPGELDDDAHRDQRE